jgi:hypothetical protein
MPSTIWKHIVNFVGILWPNWGGGGEDAHNGKERTAARGGKHLPFWKEGGEGAQGRSKKNFLTPYPFFRIPITPCQYRHRSRGNPPQRRWVMWVCRTFRPGKGIGDGCFGHFKRAVGGRESKRSNLIRSFIVGVLVDTCPKYTNNFCCRT